MTGSIISAVGCLGISVGTGVLMHTLREFSLFGQFFTSGVLSIAAGRKMTKSLVSVSVLMPNESGDCSNLN